MTMAHSFRWKNLARTHNCDLHVGSGVLSSLDPVFCTGIRQKDMNSQFSRSGKTSPYGKCDSEVKFHCADQIKQELSAVAVCHGTNTSEYQRIQAEGHLHGFIPKSMQPMFWEHAQRATSDELLLSVLELYCFGILHVLNLTNQQNSRRPGIGLHYAEHGGQE